MEQTEGRRFSSQKLINSPLKPKQILHVVFIQEHDGTGKPILETTRVHRQYVTQPLTVQTKHLAFFFFFEALLRFCLQALSPYFCQHTPSVHD